MERLGRMARPAGRRAPPALRSSRCATGSSRGGSSTPAHRGRARRSPPPARPAHASSLCSGSRWAAPSRCCHQRVPMGSVPRVRLSSALSGARRDAARGRRFAVLHGSLDRRVARHPGRQPSLFAAPIRAGDARGIDIDRTGSGARSTRRLRAPWRDACRSSRAGRWAALVGGSWRGFARRAVQGIGAGVGDRAGALPVRLVGEVPPGACVVAANHESVLDPPLLALTAQRPLRFLAKEELWRYRAGAWLMDSLGAVPVARGRGGHVAVDRAVELLGAGEPVAIFPQGSVAVAWTRGAARLALGTGVPLVPVRSSAPRKRSRAVASACPRSGSWSASRFPSSTRRRRSPPRES